MSGDPTIAPSAARERRAFAAGLRPRARWLVLAGLGLGVLVALGGTSPGEVAAGIGLGDLATPSEPATRLTDARNHLLAGTLGIAAWVAVVVVVVTLAIGGLGPVSSAERRRLAIGPIALRPSVALVGSIGVVLGVLALLRGLVAGAARAPAAGEAGLTALWAGAASRVLLVAAGLLLVAGTLELLLSRWANRRALFQTEAEARADARRSEGPRG